MNSLGSRHWFTQLGQKSILCLVAMAPSNQPFIHSDRAMASSITFPYNYASCRNRFKRRGAVCGWFLHSVSSRQPQSIHTRKFIRFFFFLFHFFFFRNKFEYRSLLHCRGRGRRRRRGEREREVQCGAICQCKCSVDTKDDQRFRFRHARPYVLPAAGTNY